MLLLGRVAQYVHHTVARLLDSDEGLLQAQIPSAAVAQVCLHPPGNQDEGVQPVIFGVDSDGVPVYDGLSRPVRGIGDRELASASVFPLC